MSIIQEHPEQTIRMAYLATVGGSKVNGVAELHSQLRCRMRGSRNSEASPGTPTRPTKTRRMGNSCLGCSTWVTMVTIGPHP
jgi:hypothetical protein